MNQPIIRSDRPAGFVQTAGHSGRGGPQTPNSRGVSISAHAGRFLVKNPSLFRHV
jgi:hypothetical protein